MKLQDHKSLIVRNLREIFKACNMTLKVVVTSREIIKPAIPTPHNLKSFKLSQIDQSVLPIHIPFILFYPAKRDDNKFQNSRIFDRLKTSLSETLTRFYPLGGRMFDNQQIECNDNGVDYVETQVGGELNHVVTSPIEDDLNQLIPCDLSTPKIGSAALLSVQVNKFECGGIAIAICTSHKIVDGATLSTFIISWATTACGFNDKIVSPRFDAATLFLPKQVASSVVLPTGTTITKGVSKRFVFYSSKISALKARASNTSYVENPTTVEAIVALIWKCAMNVSMKPSVANIAMNVRGMMTPPLPNHSFGNIVMGAVTSLTSKHETDLHGLVEKLRKAKRTVEELYMKKLPLDDVLAICQQSMMEVYIQYIKGEVEFYQFTSLFRFPWYEADFGWGKPIWINIVSLYFKNMVVLMESGDGVEAWINLDEQEMARFECQEELLAYASSSQ